MQVNRDNISALEFLSEYRNVRMDSLFCKILCSNYQLDAGNFFNKTQSTSNVYSLNIDLFVSPLLDNTIVVFYWYLWLYYETLLFWLYYISMYRVDSIIKFTNDNSKFLAIYTISLYII